MSSKEKRALDDCSARFPSIDIDFKLYSDISDDKDIDAYSRTLCDYHRILWSKPLPCGTVFELTSKKSPQYRLYHSSGLGDFTLASDSIINTYRKWSRKSIADIVSAMPKSDIEAFYDIASTIGGYIIFPANRIDGNPTINGIRGMSPIIKDRFDLTLECIRRWYSGTESPLSAHICRYSKFFTLFNDFKGYVEFFLLDDLVDAATGNVRFFLPFTRFGETEALPTSVSEYQEYMNNSCNFTMSRNLRIANWASHVAN